MEDRRSNVQSKRVQKEIIEDKRFVFGWEFPELFKDKSSVLEAHWIVLNSHLDTSLWNFRTPRLKRSLRQPEIKFKQAG